VSTNNGDNPVNSYFFLSYAHTAPLAQAEPEPTDYWVQKVFDDLSEAVRSAAKLGPGSRVGFFDGLLEAGADWKARAAQELGAAEVFVPLYSPRYFAMSWPGREWACFVARLPDQSPDEPDAHIVPVLWAPMAGSTSPTIAPDPLSIVYNVPEYAQNGLRALKMLNLYDDKYREVISRLGRKIVDVARRQPLDPSPALALDDVTSAFRHKGTEDDFIVAVAAPTRATVPSNRAASWYGDESTDWHPFGAREQLSLADHAVPAAERLNFRTAVLGVGEAADAVATTPAVVLIDPWIAEPTAGGLSGTLENLRRLYAGDRQRHWALPMIVLNADDSESQARRRLLIERLTRILEDVGAPLVQASWVESTVVTSIEEFAQAIPALVAEAERRYLRYSPDFTDDPDEEGRPVAAAPPSDDEVWERPDDSDA
jgi:FxsC-like protein